MKTSTVFIIILSITMAGVLFASNVSLKIEYEKIDLDDVFKNYVSVDSESYSVISISGSNGYPIEIVQKDTNAIKVLRSRLEHFKSVVKNDTLFIEFTGSNISMEQSFLTTTPSGIVIHKNNLSGIIATNTHQRVNGFKTEHLTLKLKGNSYIELQNCNAQTLSIQMENESHLQFSEKNIADSIALKMTHTSVANLNDVTFKKVHPVLSDSVAIVLSNEAFKNLLNN
ncbi:GIN domain-containing protein [Flagellimonas zhangzhouensis]|uniref:Putative auto-transporter adhesin head GIN domain-containing protein n=1 Tax=Flagellimonas zhangzhouensis TaxID=1073328 RepID=A0A1H2SIZ2_9FLAO|nr:DUF2807 domain-containing protein [Allomuricauda zhangzhouensis]SDQ75268.1 hypothetical protein SAMN05216294_2470 [Allomuricauda zhangzhouensis]SDW31435.1 hypothetical protein SAMN04487892_1114 [Allomuricauda zhangzhouensis]